ncbi:MAG TPA: PF20097 family protein [Thermodesulfobacteriota bacterium]|nr:PF20097 family protein [Thermodesulfobacteriota bacterium]
MKNKNELIIPAIVLALLIGVAAWILINYTGELFYYKGLRDRGVETTARVTMKAIMKDGRLVRTNITSASDDHRLMVSLRLPGSVTSVCTLRVSKPTYDVVSRRDTLSVAYLPDDPSQCTLPDSIELNFYLILSLLAVAVFLLLLAAGFVFYIYRSFRKPPPGKPVPLTTDLGLPPGGLACPRCGAQMREGYMPTVGGVSWRDREDPIGIPTMFTGLEGTVFWIKRPALHAYRCENCRIILFKYGG